MEITMSFDVFQRMWLNPLLTDFLYSSLEAHLSEPFDLDLYN